MKTKNILVIILAAMVILSANVQAVVVTFNASANVPTPGPYDIFNFVGGVRDANNVGTSASDGAFNDATTYVAFDRGSQGQTFVTGSSKPVYQVTGFWLKQPGYTAPPNTVATYWNFLNGSTLTVRVTIPAASGTPGFVMSSETYTITGSEPNKPASGAANSLTGLGVWVHAVLATPIPVGPNRTYGVDMTAAGNGFFETYGIKDSAPNGNPYTAGTAYVSGASGVGGNVLNVAPGDRVFIVELLGEAPLTASVPYPDVNATGVPQNLTLTWVPGKYADKHDVYFGTDKTKVTNANRTSPLGVLVSQNQDPNSYPVSGLVSGTTYYWRIDEVNNNAGAPAGSPWKGTVWRFTLMPTKAWAPSPYDGEICVFDSPKPTLYWNAGYNSTKSKVYFGTNPASLALKTTITHTADVRYSYQVTDTINKNTYYYWRIDEVQPDTSIITGDRWQFKTIPTIPVTDPNLKGWWKFDEGPGKAIDWSGLGQHGTVYGGTTSVAGYDVNAIKFDGLDGEVSLPIGSTISNLHSATIATWVNVLGTEAWQRIFDFGNYAGPNPPVYPAVYMSLTPYNGGGVPQFGITTTGAAGESTIVGSYALSTGVWHHVAVTINAGTDTARLYLDGVQVGENAAVTLEPNNLGDTNDNNLGKSKFWDPPNPHFNGSLDDFRIYNYAMSQDDIGKVMAPLVAWRPNPADDATEVEPTPTLSWKKGVNADKHDVYFSDNWDAVNDANSSDPSGPNEVYKGWQNRDANSYGPLTLEWDQTYYWRVDEVNDQHPERLWRGSIWSFTTRNFIPVDNFESYNNSISNTWKKGGGGTVGYSDPNKEELTIVHSGRRSMPFDYNNTNPTYSDANRTFVTDQNWTADGVKALTLWFRGYPVSVGSFVESPASTYTMTASGADIWDVKNLRNSLFHDEFHYAYMQVSSDCTIVAKVESVSNTNAYAKAGVMIRDSTDAGSSHVMVCITPTSGAALQYRVTAGGSSTEYANDPNITAPCWLKLQRQNNEVATSYDFIASYSTCGPTGEPNNWQPLGTATISYSLMPDPVCIGLSLTAHNASATCTAVFSNVTVNDETPPSWTHQDIGIKSNAAAPLYVTLQDSSTPPKAATVTHPDPNIVLQNTWQEWNIALSEFKNKTPSLDLKTIKKMTIGVGSNSTPVGTLYFDDIRLYIPRCIPTAAPTSDCLANYSALQALTNNWLVSNYQVTPVSWDPDGDPCLVAHYKFDGDFTDVKGHNGEPNGASIITDPARGQVASFDGVNDYVSLPIGLDVNSMTSTTIATWVNFSNGGGAWQRIFDFGNNTTVYMFLTPRIGTTGVMRFAITTTSSAGESIIDAPSTLARGWYHVAVVINGVSRAMQLYLDGIVVASGPTQTLPKDIGNTNNNWLGRSQWAADAYFTGYLDDFRIYSRALPPDKVAWLAGKRTTFTQPLYLLLTPHNPGINLYNDGRIDLKDYAVLAEKWLEVILWP